MHVFSAEPRYNSTWLGHILRTCFTPKIVFVLLAEGEWKRLVLQRQSLVVEVLLKNTKRDTARWRLQCVCVCVRESFIPRRDVRFWTYQPNSETLCTYFLQAQDGAPVVSCFAAFSPACRCNAAIPDMKASSCTAHIIWMWYVDTGAYGTYRFVCITGLQSCELPTFHSGTCWFVGNTWQSFWFSLTILYNGIYIWKYIYMPL